MKTIGTLAFWSVPLLPFAVLGALGGWHLVWLFVQAFVMVLLISSLGAMLLWAAALFVGGIGVFVAELLDALWRGGGIGVKRYLRELKEGRPKLRNPSGHVPIDPYEFY